eukprot:Clim_evm104s149 gene=Clim_evmTU104s149
MPENGSKGPLFVPGGQIISRHKRRRLHPCRRSTEFDFKHKVGSGAYGEVHMAAHRKTGKTVAMKKILTQKSSGGGSEGIPLTALREIKILKQLDHPNIVALLEVMYDPTNHAAVFMAFEYCENDLRALINRERFDLGQIKCYFQQLLWGLWYLHVKKIIHRDLKTANILINNEGILKLADFGLAREMNDSGRYTNRVITLWYRPPELILCDKSDNYYDERVDMWGAGCILAEMFMRKPYLRGGDTEMEQLKKIWEVCGDPLLQGFSAVRDYGNWNFCRPPAGAQSQVPKFADRVPKDGNCYGQVPPDAVDLLTQLLSLNPQKRPTAGEALDHNFFWTQPMPSRPDSLPKYRASHQTRRERHGRMIIHYETGISNSSSASSKKRLRRA